MIFTIVTVCYNAEKCVRNTIENVLSQQRDLFEYIIIDGASKDKTMDIIDEYRNHIDIIVSESDTGIYDAMNKAIDMANGDYINFMNAGDGFVGQEVLKDVSSLINADKPDVVFGHEVLWLDGFYYQVEAQPFYAPPYLKHSMGFNHQCCFVKTQTAKRYLFDLKYKLAADYNMIMTIYRNKGTFQKVDMPIACFDMNGISGIHKFRHDSEVFAIERPNKPIANYIEVRKRAVIREIKRLVKPIAVALFPHIMEKKRGIDSRYKQLKNKIDL